MAKSEAPETAKRRQRHRVTRPLPHEADQRLRGYVLAASAAGVGMLALAQPAHAQVVHTSANISITNGDLFLNLNCGSKVQFWFADFGEVSSYGYVREFAVNGTANASVIADKHGPLALQAGSVIGSSRSFKNVHRGEQILAEAFTTGYGSSGVSGNWANGKQAYLGLRFNIQGQVHYGWASLEVVPSIDQHHGLHVDATLLGYAYENTPNKSIQAGQTKGEDIANSDVFTPPVGTLGALARGAPSLGHCPDVEPHVSRRRAKRSR